MVESWLFLINDDSVLTDIFDEFSVTVSVEDSIPLRSRRWVTAIGVAPVEYAKNADKIFVRF